MKKSAIQGTLSSFDKYINLVEDIDLQQSFEKSLQQLNEINIQDILAVGLSVYAPGKWTIHDILQHIADTERIFAYRALRFARNDQTRLHGFEQSLFAANANASERKLTNLLNELKVIRQSNIILFQSFDNEMLLRKGICNNTEISVLALGFTIVGHQIHHLRIMEEKYLPLGKK